MGVAKTKAADSRDIQADLRRRGRRARAELTPRYRAEASERIVDSVIRSGWFRRARLLACYLSVADEVETWALIERAWRMKKRIFVPVTKKNSRMLFREITPETMLERSRFGLLEPRDGMTIAPRRLDVVITPVVVYDEFRHRIGMGGGYFDRTFAFLRHRRDYWRPKLVGLAYACQKVEKIPANPWDIRVFEIVSE